MTSTKPPTEYGFADNGELWDENGEAPALVAFLEQRGTEFRDWFVHAQWATDEQRAVHNLPAVSDVHPIQDYINVDAVERYKTAETVDTNKNDYERYPVLFQWNGAKFVFQGTHRLAAHYENGATTYEGYFLNLDTP